MWMHDQAGAKPCDIGGEFRAQDATGHFLIGNPYEYAPTSIRGNSRNARRCAALKYQSAATPSASTRSPSRRASRLRAEHRDGLPGPAPLPQARHRHVGQDAGPEAPQSLVYWCDADNNWTLAAFMFRADGTTRPDIFGRMIQWHKHGPTAHWMTHVWLVNDPVEAFATCAPFNAFAREGPFTYQPYTIDAQVDPPCADSIPEGDTLTSPSLDQAP